MREYAQHARVLDPSQYELVPAREPAPVAA
jgi:hypothetical protein